MLTSVIAAQPMVKAGRLRPLGVTTLKRAAVLPDVPAIAETLPGYEVINWWGIVAPAGTPQAAVGKINAELQHMLRETEVRERLAREGAEPVGNSPAEFAGFIRSEIAKWSKVVRDTGATID